MGRSKETLSVSELFDAMNIELITCDANVAEWKGKKESDIWVNEAIWGHRIEEQALHALLLEFLGMAEGMFREEKLLEETSPDQDVQYRARKAAELRVILFLNPDLEKIASKHEGDDEKAWEEWFAFIRNSGKSGHPNSYDYLKDRFPRFADFADRVQLIRRAVMDVGNAKQWNYQLLYPIGPDALFIPTDEKFGRNRILFTRTGELAYLMLTRADKSLRDELAIKFQEKFDASSQKNRLVASLLPDSLISEAPNGGTYLPYKKHQAFDRLAQDLLNLLRLNLPENDVFDIMKHLIAFNLYVYTLETTRHSLGKARMAPIVCEILNTKSDVVRRYSGINKSDNEEKALKAVEQFFDKLISDNESVRATINDPKQPEQVKIDTLKELFDKQLALKKPPEADSSEAFLKATISIATAACRRGVMKAQSSLGRTAGLITKQGTNRLRYCPSDPLLRALILVNVTERTEEAKVLDSLYERYKIIISKEHAAKEELDDQFIEMSHYDKNKERLTRRLIALGLATRKSDACTYIHNPYYE